MATFTPKSREELARLLPEGKYQFSVSAAEEKRSKAGSDMIELRLEMYGEDGGKYFVTDRLIFMESCMFKVYAFCEATGLMDRYEAGDLKASDCLDRSGWCKVVKKTDDFGAKNEVKNYVKPDAKKPTEEKRRPPQNKPVSKEGGGDGDIPF